MGDTSEILRQSGGGNTEFLVSKAKAGSDAAWREIYRRYERMLIAQVQAAFPGLRHRRFDRADALQQAFMNAWANIQGFEYRTEGAFRRWLSALVLNAFRNLFEARGPRESEADSGVLRQVEDHTPEGNHARRQQNAATLEALGKLDEVDRDILIQYIVEESSFERIAETQGVSREKLRQLYARAMEHLTRLLREG
jgi:RNA polymerase sigma factor (sigma-70 family)